MSLKAIASALGLSVTTVSRALNGYDDVAKETRNRIEQEAKRRGYRPNTVAQRLKMGRANAVGLVFPVTPVPLNADNFMEMISAIAQSLAGHEIDLLLIADDSRDGYRSSERMLRSQCIDALIVSRTSPHDDRLKHLQQKGYPFLALGRSQLEQAYAWFDFDNYAGPVLAVDHYVAQGLTRIAYLGSHDSSTFVIDRRQGYLDALKKHHIPWRPDYQRAIEPSRRSGYHSARELLALTEPPQAIITDCALLGDGVAIALREANRLSGKQHIALMVYDGLPADSVIDHPVASIMQATRVQIGHQIAQMVLHLLQAEPLNKLQVLWQPKLVLPDQ